MDSSTAGDGSTSADGPPLDVELSAVPSELSTVRRAIAGLPVPAEVVDDATLLANELMTNSIRHAGLAPEDRIRVQARVLGDRLRVDVIDEGEVGLPASVCGGIRPAPGARSGWGLYFVESLSTRWGHSRGRYWFELELPPPDEPG